MADPLATTTSPSALPTQASSAPQIHLRAPSQYTKSQQDGARGDKTWTPPPLSWLEATWSVTHSTLPMWRKAKNVRITYKLLPPGEGKGDGVKVVCIDDEVSSVPTEKTWLPQPKSIRGVDTPDDKVVAAWNWRGRGLLRVASSYWEVLGWGEFDSGEGGDAEGKERWVVTWFKASLFTPMGVDVYSSRKEGISEALYRAIEGALERGDAGEEVRDMCKGEMRGVVIDDA